jgi:hypothetical protein
MFVLYAISATYNTVIEALSSHQIIKWLFCTLLLFYRPILIISGVLPIQMNFNQQQVNACEINAFLQLGKS